MATSVHAATMMAGDEIRRSPLGRRRGYRLSMAQPTRHPGLGKGRWDEPNQPAVSSAPDPLPAGSKRHQWIDPARPPRRHGARHDRDHDEHAGPGDKRGWIVRPY